MFVGDSLALYRTLNRDGGSASVIIDGEPYGFARFQFTEERWQVPAYIDNLAGGIHTIDIQVQRGKVYIDAFAVPDQYSPSLAQQEALSRVNYFRALTGIPLARGVHAIFAAAQSHAEFVANNRSDPRLAGLGFHSEPPDLPGYTGGSSSDRAKYFGYPGWTGEDGHGIGAPIRAVDDWMATVYHRNLVLCYGCTDLGYGVVNDSRGRFDVLNMGSRPYAAASDRLIYTYPVDAQLDVPAGWNGGEIPDPLPNKLKPVGYPISLYMIGASIFEVDRAELRDLQDRVVPTYVLDSLTDFMIGNTVFLVPTQPLAQGTTYSVRIAGVDSWGEPFDRTWSFVTQR